MFQASAAVPLIDDGLTELAKQTFWLIKPLGELLGNNYPLHEYAVFLALLMN